MRLDEGFGDLLMGPCRRGRERLFSGIMWLDDSLTDQQREGTRLAAAGWTGIDIAQSLGVR
jgi:hypothetical protein